MPVTQAGVLLAEREAGALTAGPAYDAFSLFLHRKLPGGFTGRCDEASQLARARPASSLETTDTVTVPVHCRCMLILCETEGFVNYNLELLQLHKVKNIYLDILLYLFTIFSFFGKFFTSASIAFLVYFLLFCKILKMPFPSTASFAITVSDQGVYSLILWLKYIFPR